MSLDPAAQTRPRVQATTLMIALLASLCALGQFATNIYLPSLPAIRDEFLSTDGMAQLTLTAYLIGFAVTQLFYGPITDRYGRKPLLIFGVALFVAASAVCTFAPTMELLVTGRVLQALGAAASLVVARAVVRDSFEGSDLHRVMSLISIFFALVPGLSPFLGGILEETVGWRWIFGLTGGVGVAVFVWMLAQLPETLANPLPRLNVGSLVSGYRYVLGVRPFMCYALANFFIFAAMFAFFGGSPKVYIEILGVSPTEYGLYPPLSTIGFVIGGIFVRKNIDRLGPAGICRIGMAVLIAAVVIMVGLPLVGIVHKHGFNGAMILFVSGIGIFLPTAMACALQIFPERAGTASAMMGFLQMAGASAGSATTGMLLAWNPVLAFPVVMLVSVLIAAAVFFGLRETEAATAGAHLS